MRYTLKVTPQAQRDAKKLNRSHLKNKAQELIDLVLLDPFAPHPPYEKLGGDFEGAYSRRLNAQHRLVYQVDIKMRVVKILRMWTHYE